ncbi:Zn-dependent exopeptidase [Neoconidiobolus thromboides FSU 785]|nr:Zn-dependent exopeptidase [Neoconidiobolus thromboides FSU 785]
MVSLKVLSVYAIIALSSIQGTTISKGSRFFIQSQDPEDVIPKHHVLKKVEQEEEEEEGYPFSTLIEALKLNVVDSTESLIKEVNNFEDFKYFTIQLAEQMNLFSGLTDIDAETKEFLLTKRKYKFSHDGPVLDLSPIEAYWRKVQTNEKYFDVTDEDELDLKVAKAIKNKIPLPTGPTHIRQVNGYLENLSEDSMKRFLTKLTSFYTRYYRSKSGVDSSHFIFDSLNEVLKKKDGVKITLDYFKHSWPQSSIIARFEGSDKKDEIIVVGAHQDSVNQWIPWFGRAPGADDDGSGSTSIYDAFRVLVEGGFKPNRTLEFHWYSGEEAGLLGSQDIAKAYSHQNKNVVAMMHFDMTGHFARKEQIAVVEDFTDPALSAFLRKLIDQYSDLKWVNSRCGYACSDHASWNKYGFRSAFPIEDPDIESNPNIHSPSDTVDTISFHHVHQFSRLAAAFAVELSA